MAFTISINGLDELSDRLSAGTIEKKLVKAVGLTALQLHNLLTAEVKDTYSTRRSLNSALVDKTTSNVKRGVNFIEGGLSYAGEPLKLTDFPREIFPLDIRSKFIAPNIFTPDLKGKITRTKPVEGVAVYIKRNKSTFIEGGFRGRVSGKVRVLRRNNFLFGGQTWITLPTKEDLLGERTSYSEVLGPSLAKMAEKVYLSSGRVQNFKDNFSSHVVRNLDL